MLGSPTACFYAYLFGTDFMLAELQVYALTKKWMPEYEGGFWHFIRLPEAYMMPVVAGTSGQ